MSSEGLHFNFDTNENQMQGDRHSPTTLDDANSMANRRPPNLMIPRQGSVEHTHFERILKRTDDSLTISELPYHIREDVKESLNEKKESREDWRGVASRMGVKPKTIEKIANEFKKDPTEKVFKEISNEKITKLLQILYQMKRDDVLNIFYREIYGKSGDVGASEKREKYLQSKFPSQESTPNNTPSSATSSTSGFLSPANETKDVITPDSAERSDSGMGSIRSQPEQSRKKSGSFAKQNTDENLAQRVRTALNFHSKVSADFWDKIPPTPGSTTKEWKKVEEALKKDFKECMQSQVMRFICYVLKVEPYEQRHTMFVHDRDFANLVAWFGPVKSGQGGLFEKIARLIKESITYKGSSGPHSFFAGYMTKEEADKLIGDADKVGTFLIRFSSTYAETGSFVVCLKTDNGSEHVLLEGNPLTGKISYNGKDYDDLVTLWRRGLSKGGVSQDNRTSCTTICPDLPLNAMFKPYGAGPRPPQAVGRGRGRGRGQEQ